MTREEKITNIINYFNDNEEEFIAIIEELDSWNGYLGDDRYYSMDELGELYSGCDPTDILNRAFYGYDEDTWHTDEHGDKHYGAFNPNRKYFTFNGYGNLVSSDYKDYSAHLDHWFIESLEENRAYLYSVSDEVAELLDTLENEEVEA